MIYSKYDFNEDAQLKLLALFIRKPAELLGIVEPRYFSNPIHIDIARLVKGCYSGKNPKTDRLEKTSLRALLWKYPKKEHRKSAYELKKTYRRVIREIFDVSLGDRAFMLDLAFKFAKEGRFREALVEAEKDVNIGNYERAVKRFQDAAQSTTHEKQSVTLPIYHVHRLISGADSLENQSNHLVYPIIPRGGAVLLYGLPKELKSWFAAAFFCAGRIAKCGKKGR